MNAYRDYRRRMPQESAWALVTFANNHTLNLGSRPQSQFSFSCRSWRTKPDTSYTARRKQPVLLQESAVETSVIKGRYGEGTTVEIVSLSKTWVAVSKPAGMLVHRSKLYHSTPGETYLVDHVACLVAERLGFPQTVLPVQRLDRPTSGILVFALGESTNAARLQAALQRPDTTKQYWVLAAGANMPKKWVNDNPLKDLTGKNRKRRPARTEFEQLSCFEESDISAVRARISTGRRHQIRRHLSHARFPVLGDTSHGKGEINRRVRELYGVSRCCLHAWMLQFEDPESSSPVELQVPLPSDLREVLRRLPDYSEEHHQHCIVPPRDYDSVR